MGAAAFDQIKSQGKVANDPRRERYVRCIADALIAELPSPWREQTWAIAVMAVAAVALNWITTGDHLLSTLSRGYWPVAGIDLFLLGSAVIAVLTARKLGQRAHAKHAAHRENAHA